MQKRGARPRKFDALREAKIKVALHLAGKKDATAGRIIISASEIESSRAFRTCPTEPAPPSTLRTRAPTPPSAFAKALVKALGRELPLSAPAETRTQKERAHSEQTTKGKPPSKSSAAPASKVRVAIAPPARPAKQKKLQPTKKAKAKKSKAKKPVINGRKSAWLKANVQASETLAARAKAGRQSNLEARKSLNAVLAGGAASRNNPSLPTFEQLLSSIETVPPEYLIPIWVRETKALAVLGADRGPSAMDLRSRDVIACIEREWLRRQEEAQLQGKFFKWPSTIALSGNGGLQADDWHEAGFFSLMGYHVGMSSTLRPESRRYLLDRIFASNLPPLNGLEYMALWGDRTSAMRLRRMAESLASFARSAKGRKNMDYSKAISDWEADLKYLYVTYYQGVFRFHWPAV